MKKLLIKNSVSGVLQIIITLAFTFLVVRIFINKLGPELYGVFSLISIIGNLNVLTGLGITTALVKFVAEQGKSRQSNIDILTGLIIISFILIPITALAIGLKEFFLINVLNVPEQYLAASVNLYVLLIIANYFLFLGQIFVAVLDSIQMIFVNNIIQVCYNFIYWGAIYFVLWLNFSLNEIGYAIFSSALIWFAAMLIAFIKLWGKFEFTGFKSGFLLSAKKQIKFGSQIYTSSLISFFYEPFTKILISNFLGIKEVGYFDIAIKLRNIIWNLIAKALQPLYPLLSSLKEDAKIKGIVWNMSNKTAIIVIPCIAVIVLIIYPLINLWIKQDAFIISIISGFIISFYLIAIIYMPLYAYLMTRHPHKTIILQSANVIANAVGFFATYKFIGTYSIIVANSFAILSSTLLCRYYQKKYLDSIIFTSNSQLLKILITFFVIIIPGFFISITLTGDIFTIIVIALYSFTAVVISFRYLKIISKEDIDLFFENFPVVRKFSYKLFIR